MLPILEVGTLAQLASNIPVLLTLNIAILADSVHFNRRKLSYRGPCRCPLVSPFNPYVKHITLWRCD